VKITEVLPGRKVPLKLLAPGYAPWEQVVTPQPGEELQLSPRLKRLPGGELTLETIPPRAAIEVNGAKYSDRTPVKLVLPVGEYEIRVSIEGREEVVKVAVKDGATLSRKIDLTD
jgi:hypothetical protein